jgi:hypothetical protein
MFPTKAVYRDQMYEYLLPHNAFPANLTGFEITEENKLLCCVKSQPANHRTNFEDVEIESFYTFTLNDTHRKCL